MGYFPGIGTIGNKVVYFENRDGNANVKFEQASTLTRMYKLLNDNNIFVTRSRMDAGSYAKEIIDIVVPTANYFTSAQTNRQKCTNRSDRLVSGNR